MKVSHSVSGAVRQFSYWIANGTVGYPLLEEQIILANLKKVQVYQKQYMQFL